MRLKDRVAVVTGAASGIGHEIARTFAVEGAKIVIADLNQQGADAAAKELDASGKRAVGIAMDVSSEPQVEAGMAKAIAAFGRLDILVSNAGIQIVAPLSPLDFLSSRTFRMRASCWASKNFKLLGKLTLRVI
jgi:3-hydroxybutyrate dehydrogenase